MKAIENNDSGSQENITSLKNTLRDFPSTITTSSFETIEELRAQWPTGSLDLPRNWY
jgi:hypothetical protein